MANGANVRIIGMMESAKTLEYAPRVDDATETSAPKAKPDGCTHTATGKHVGRMIDSDRFKLVTAYKRRDLVACEAGTW